MAGDLYPLAAGAAGDVEELARREAACRNGPLTLVMVEPNTRLALAISPRTVIMDRGRIVYDGASDTLKRDPQLLERMIGVSKR